MSSTAPVAAGSVSGLAWELSIDNSVVLALGLSPINVQAAATFAGVSTGTVTKDTAATLTVTAAATVDDVNTGEEFFMVETITGTYGSLVIDVDGNWTYTADNTQAAIQALTAADTLTDTLTVQSADGTTLDIVITIQGVDTVATLVCGHTPNTRIARILDRLRTQIVPEVIAGMNTDPVTIVRRVRTADPTDSLAYTWVETEEQVYAVLHEPSAENMETGLMTISDYEVLIPVHCAAILDEHDAIRIDGADFDVVGIQHHPKQPNAVAYRYWAKRLS